MKLRRNGFTLVEVILVLGIASVITTGVLMAAAGAQRNGRDATRRADTDKLSTALEQYAANNNGKLPGTLLFDSVFGTTASPGTLFTDNYLDTTKFKDPKTGSQYSIKRGPAPPAGTKSNGTQLCPTGNIYYNYDSSQNTYKLQTCLESGVYNFTP